MELPLYNLGYGGVEVRPSKLRVFKVRFMGTPHWLQRLAIETEFCVSAGHWPALTQNSEHSPQTHDDNEQLGAKYDAISAISK